MKNKATLIFCMVKSNISDYKKKGGVIDTTIVLSET